MIAYSNLRFQVNKATELHIYRKEGLHVAYTERRKRERERERERESMSCAVRCIYTYTCTCTYSSCIMYKYTCTPHVTCCVHVMYTHHSRLTQSMEQLSPLPVDEKEGVKGFSTPGATPIGTPRMPRSRSKSKLARRSSEPDLEGACKFLVKYNMRACLYVLY